MGKSGKNMNLLEPLLDGPNEYLRLCEDSWKCVMNEKKKLLQVSLERGERQSSINNSYFTVDGAHKMMCLR